MPETTIFGHYEVLQRDDGSPFELGRGSMGITYKAMDTSLHRPVALKVINAASINSEVARQRFVREARAAAQLRHRNVASVFHLGTHEQTYFYAMEFIEGETVESIVRRRGALRPPTAFRIAVQVARALNAAEQHALIHRDIKPSNLMLVREDEELVVKVIDFGLAKSSLAGEESTGDITIGVPGFVGTPHFASPEQLEERDLDIRSDIYSLGVTLWYMLVGEAPFQGSLAQVMSQHLKDPPPVERIAFLPEPVQQVLLDLLAKDRAQRPQDAAEARTKLETCIELLEPESSEPNHQAEVDLFPEKSTAPRPSLRSKGFHPGAIVAGRYELVRDLGECNCGWAFAVEDLRDGTAARLLVIQADWESDPVALRQLEQEVEKLRALSHPNILGVLGIQRAGDASFILLEWTTGFSLLDLIRSRQAIDIDEALILLKQLAAGADVAAGQGFSHLDFSLSQILIHFPAGEEEPERRLAIPLDRWPDFHAKINALGITHEFATAEALATGNTFVGAHAVPSRSPDEAPMRRYVQSLAAVVYELLGGSLSPLMLGGLEPQAVSHYTPLPALPEAANAVMKRALGNAAPFQSAAEFRADFEAAIEAATAAAAVAPRSAPLPEANEPVRTAKATPLSMAPRTKPTLSGSLPRVPWLALGAIAALVLALAGLLMMKRPAQPPLAASSSPPPAPAPSAPAASPVPTAAPSPPPVETIAPTPAPASPPDTDTQMKSALQQAADYEALRDWPKAIAAYVAFTTNFPGVDTARIRLAALLSNLAPTLEKMTPGQFAPLQPGIAQAATQDVPAAMTILGSQLRTQSPKDAFAWFCAAAARGDANAMTQAGLIVSNGTGVPRDYAQAAQWFQMAANAGDPAGKTCLAECYLYGTGVRKDERRAVALLQDAVTAGDARAMNLLGSRYHQGIGGPKNYAEAFRLFSEAHDLGLADAAANLGVLYMNGDGVARDSHKGVDLFLEGAQAGSAYSMYLLARCLERGTGILANQFQAEGWYRKAAAGGNPMAIAWCNSRHLAIEKPSP